MNSFLDWRKMTSVLVLWSGYVVTWALITGSGPAIFTLWWLVGMIVLGSLWLATQPLFQRGRDLVDLHRNHRATEPPSDAG